MVFCFVQKKIFTDNTRVRIFILFVGQNANFFLQNSTLGYMTKTLNQIIFVFLHQNQNIFFSNIGNQNIFLEKNHNPPLQVKWSFPNWTKNYTRSLCISFHDLIKMKTNTNAINNSLFA